MFVRLGFNPGLGSIHAQPQPRQGSTRVKNVGLVPPLSWFLFSIQISLKIFPIASIIKIELRCFFSNVDLFWRKRKQKERERESLEKRDENEAEPGNRNFAAGPLSGSRVWIWARTISLASDFCQLFIYNDKELLIPCINTQTSILPLTVAS